jgi:hypothetical protein
VAAPAPWFSCLFPAVQKQNYTERYPGATLPPSSERPLPRSSELASRIELPQELIGGVLTDRSGRPPDTEQGVDM